MLTEDGRLSLEQLPFRAGQTVEVIVLPTAHVERDAAQQPLQGMVVRYERPTEPVAEEDWDALQ